MRNLLLILILALGAVVANAQYTDYLKDEVSLQQACEDCPKNYKLYNGVRFTFFEGRIIGMSEFRQVAALIGEAVGIRYNRSGVDNIAILHAKLSVDQFNLIMGSVKGVIIEVSNTSTTPVIMATSTKDAQVGGSVEDDATMTTEQALEQGLKVIEAGELNYVHVDTIAMKRIVAIRFVYDPMIEEIELLPPFEKFEWLIDVNARWNTCSEAIDLRKARYAIVMAKKYGGYSEGPVGYKDGWFNVQTKQDKFCYKEGDKIPFLGFSEGAYKKYYQWEKPKSEGRITSRSSRSRRTSKARSLPMGVRNTKSPSVAASRRACRRG